MTIVQISYGWTFNRGNFQSERIDLTATLAEDDDVGTAKLLLQAEVLRLGGDDDGAEAVLAEVYGRVNRSGEQRGE